MSALEQALGGPAIEVVAKATRRRFTVEYKRKIVREADVCKVRVDGRGRRVAAADQCGAADPLIVSSPSDSRARGWLAVSCRP
jgi:hypothetical protein